MTIPQPVRALALAKEHLPKCKDAAYIISLLETKAKRAQAKAPAKAKRVQVRRLLRRAGEVPKTKSDWMREADKWFSRFIRLRDTNENSNGPRSGLCVTCGDHRLMIDLDCGHWIRREHWGTRYHEKNCHAQCSYRCNNLGGGKEREHAQAIDRIHGVGTSDELLRISKTNKRKPGSFDFQAIAEKYEKKVLELGGWPTA